MIYLEMCRVSTLGHCPDGCLSSEVAGGALINDRSGVPLSPFHQSGMHVAYKQFCFALPFCFKKTMSFAVTCHSKRAEIRTEELGFARATSKRIKEGFGPRLQAYKLLLKTLTLFCYFWLLFLSFSQDFSTDSLSVMFFIPA